MIDHCGILVAKEQFDDIVKFYVATLEPLGYKKLHEYAGMAVGLGEDGADFWIGAKGDAGGPSDRHIAFRAKDRATVKKFYDAAMTAGAKDNGEPGPRAHYHENYYGAFILDPLGNNIEACCHHPEV
ncbi:Glyoxalase/Bleomycin resistance protein/Dihydroxybiphenyl dioxygenase [Rhizodiscina lignyota]|uniref:Glyoxalase/Bleomycin resistance protein/Dihydroxybiphenyl dioxygenase n=1 Tax=Rhizodiscina lignyota TaxID=1504668 RepID=A0A9P4M146_9PEZI|nr:Glyoxalase/Bleomycin resistance protein/Dihydroxybiphenyl dioxygenase [Rhizodiscina lignyota]